MIAVYFLRARPVEDRQRGETMLIRARSTSEGVGEGGFGGEGSSSGQCIHAYRSRLSAYMHAHAHMWRARAPPAVSAYMHAHAHMPMPICPYDFNLQGPRWRMMMRMTCMVP